MSAAATTPHSMPEASERIQKLERSLAFEYALQCIEQNCNLVDLSEGSDELREWFESTPVNPDYATVLGEAIEYLEWRGLLLRCSHRDGTFIAVKDEHEEAAQEGTAS